MGNLFGMIYIEYARACVRVYIILLCSYEYNTSVLYTRYTTRIGRIALRGDLVFLFHLFSLSFFFSFFSYIFPSRHSAASYILLEI